MDVFLFGSSARCLFRFFCSSDVRAVRFSELDLTVIILL